MTVSELIELLKTYPQDLLVAREIYSEQYLLKPENLTIDVLCEPRRDGSIQNYRKDKPYRQYLVIDGN